MDSSIPHVSTCAAGFDDRYIPDNRSTGEIGESSRYPAMHNVDASTSTINNPQPQRQVIRRARNASPYYYERRVDGGYNVISPYPYEQGLTAVQYEEGGDIWAVLPETFGLQDDSDSDSDAPSKAVKSSKAAAKGLTRKTQRIGRGPVPIYRGAVYVINVDGYYRKGCSGSIPKGGFGILIRRRGAESVAAKTGCAAVGKSEFYHTVEGIKKGLEMVRGMYPGITKLYVSCNSDSVAFEVNQCFQSSRTDGYCGVHASTSYGFCESCCLRCFSHPVMDADDSATICGYMKTIVKLGRNYCRTSLVTNCERYLNKPADYLAKMQIARGEESVFEPHQFPSELWALVRKAKKIGELRCYPQ